MTSQIYDVIIVGSGPAGMASAYQLQGRSVLMLDVGNKPPQVSNFDDNLFDLKEKRDLFTELVGNSFESLHNIDQKYLSPKLKAPLMRYVTNGAEKLAPIQSNEFEMAQSFAYGGLANAWGAGMLRFNDYDLQGFPISYTDLKPFYDKLSDIIGISGENDDLSLFFGNDEKFQEPHQIGFLGSDLLKIYNKHKKNFNTQGIFIGRNRLGLLTKEKDGRKPCQYDNLEFYKSNIPANYNPTYTLDRLINDAVLIYKSGYLVKFYREENNLVEIHALNLNSQKIEIFKSKTIVLAAGCINTAKIILQSNEDFETKLPIYDNPISYVPFLVPKFIGRPIEKKAYSAQLIFVHEDPLTKERINGSFYGLSGPMKSDLFFEFPLSIKANLAAVKYLVPAIAIMQIFYYDKDHPSNYLHLTRDNKIFISYKEKPIKNNDIEKKIISSLRKFGYLSHSSLCKFPAPGNSFHYAGSVPMKTNPKRYQTTLKGNLWNSDRIFIADSANFPAFPAKNHSYTIMANAMRISEHLKAQLNV
ncbi:MAG: hypothetical protein SH817_12510 [Leptospira sp.]|nr:hypothetical protein [Leptospira sp.]